MNGQKISRKTFLKTLIGFLLGGAALARRQFLSERATPQDKGANPKEAKYYKQADQLAG